MADWASSGGIKVKRAKQHIDDLADQIATFRRGNPYRVLIHPDPKTGETLGIVHAEAIPPMWGAIAGDAIHNLRASLDVLWRQVTNPRPAKRDRRQKQWFPFLAAHKLEARYRREKEPAVKNAWKLILEIAPYKGGNDDLCLLHAADLADKHEVATIVASRMGWSGEPLPHDHTFYLTAASPSPPLENGHVWFVLPPTLPPMDMEMKLTFEVAFGEGGPLKSKTVLPTLANFAEEVDSIVEAFITAGLLS